MVWKSAQSMLRYLVAGCDGSAPHATSALNRAATKASAVSTWSALAPIQSGRLPDDRRAAMGLALVALIEAQPLAFMAAGTIAMFFFNMMNTS